MRFYKIIFGLLILALVASCSGFRHPAAQEHGADIPPFNKIVLEKVKGYPTDGTHDYAWIGGYDGATRDVFMGEEKVMKGHEKKTTYCCGITLEVFLEAYKEWLKEKGGAKASVVPPDKWGKFKQYWFVRELNGPGPSDALEEFGLGRTIPLDQALPGDFVQIWRTVKEGRKTPSGHSVIFIDWAKDAGGNIVGFKYWSSQPGTDGIGYQTELFGPNGGVNPEHTHFGRMEPRAKEVAQARKAENKEERKEAAGQKRKETKMKK